mmetsp:Transcript_26329/g.43125  ORF Transcript_26329/g.43125 Transcript_26329/m.43125 type:complete len:105 (+) Transcript_26329:2348-2662(+)
MRMRVRNHTSNDNYTVLLLKGQEIRELGGLHCKREGLEQESHETEVLKGKKKGLTVTSGINTIKSKNVNNISSHAREKKALSVPKADNAIIAIEHFRQKLHEIS